MKEEVKRNRTRASWVGWPNIQICLLKPNLTAPKVFPFLPFCKWPFPSFISNLPLSTSLFLYPLSLPPSKHPGQTASLHSAWIILCQISQVKFLHVFVFQLVNHFLEDLYQGATNPLARRPGATKLSRRASKSNYHLPDSGKWYFYSNFLVSKNSTIHPSTSYPSSKSRSKKAIVPISKKLHRQLASSASSARMQQWHFKPWMPLPAPPTQHGRPWAS